MPSNLGVRHLDYDFVLALGLFDWSLCGLGMNIAAIIPTTANTIITANDRTNGSAAVASSNTRIDPMMETPNEDGVRAMTTVRKYEPSYYYNNLIPSSPYIRV